MAVKGTQESDWTAIEFPSNVLESVASYLEMQSECVGWCLVYNRPILTEEEMVPDTNLHHCA